MYYLHVCVHLCCEYRICNVWRVCALGPAHTEAQVEGLAPCWSVQCLTLSIQSLSMKMMLGWQSKAPTIPLFLLPEITYVVATP